MLYSAYSIPNLVLPLPLLGGQLIDRIGSSTIMLVLSFLTCLGQFVFCIGVDTKSFFWMIMGRMIFGVGGETLSVAQTRMTTRHFRGKELAFALGLNLSVARLGSVANDLISPVLGEKVSISFAMWFGLLTCLLSAACSFVLAWIDSNVNSSSFTSQDDYLMAGSNSGSHELTVESFELHEQHDNLKEFERGRRADRNVSSMDSADSQSVEVIGDFSGLVSGNNNTSKKTLFESISEFPLPFWLINGIMISLYASVIPFNTIHQAFLQSKSYWYPNDPIKAAQIMSLPDTLSALLVPFVGTFVDSFGWRPQILLICSIMISSCHFALGYATEATVPSPIPALFILGLSYALLLTFWPCIPLLIEPASLATAYGLVTTLQNFCYFLFPIIVAGLIHLDNTYTLTETFFASLGVIGCLCSIALWWIDDRRLGGVLRRPDDSKDKIRREYEGVDDGFENDEDGGGTSYRDGFIPLRQLSIPSLPHGVGVPVLKRKTSDSVDFLPSEEDVRGGYEEGDLLHQIDTLLDSEVILTSPTLLEGKKEMDAKKQGNYGGKVRSASTTRSTTLSPVSKRKSVVSAEREKGRDEVDLDEIDLNE